jgi:hypothetical protein
MASHIHNITLHKATEPWTVGRDHMDNKHVGSRQSNSQQQLELNLTGFSANDLTEVHLSL